MSMGVYRLCEVCKGILPISWEHGLQGLGPEQGWVSGGGGGESPEFRARAGLGGGRVHPWGLAPPSPAELELQADTLALECPTKGGQALF